MNLVLEHPMPVMRISSQDPGLNPRPWSAGLTSAIPIRAPQHPMRRQILAVPPFPIPACP